MFYDASKIIEAAKTLKSVYELNAPRIGYLCNYWDEVMTSIGLINLGTIYADMGIPYHGVMGRSYWDKDGFHPVYDSEKISKYGYSESEEALFEAIYK